MNAMTPHGKSPATVLRVGLARANMTATEFCTRSSFSKGHLSEVLQGRKPVSPRMAAAAEWVLGDDLGMPARDLLLLQVNLDLAEAQAQFPPRPRS
jgi:plasmid maintenance system antidote protein VapI